MKRETVCIVAIFKNEEPFMDEWIVYHRAIGVDHFYLYDDNPSFPLSSLVQHHSSYLTIVPWGHRRASGPGLMNQLEAYRHAVENYVSKHDWTGFLDGDEFVVLRKHLVLGNFLSQLGVSVASCSLNWHVFGHNGYYENPQGLVTASLTRRMKKPSIQVKSFTRSHSIKAVESPHCCAISQGIHVDANGRRFSQDLYDGRTAQAHINHYQCRSFMNWMGRAHRGDVNFGLENCPDAQKWRLTEASCLMQFVTTVALNKNEYEDRYMLKYEKIITKELLALKARGGPLLDY